MNKTISELSISKHCYWVRDGEARLYTALHYPSNRRLRSTGIVICNPLGHEYVHSYRTLRRLADRLAQAGFPVIRFDYQGTGNSSGDMNDEQLVAKWQSNIARQVESLRERFSLQRCALVGFRFGAQLAESVSNEIGCNPLVLWSPTKNNKQYIREIRALSRLADYEQLSDSQIECAGFIYPDQLLQDIADLRSSMTCDRQDSSVLLVGSNTEQHVDRLSGHGNIETLEQSAIDLENALLEPHLSVIPESTIASIEEFLVTECADRAKTQASVSEDSEAFPSEKISNTVTESICWQDNPRISGVLSQHSESASPGGTVVVLPNAGSVHNIGPNRVYVELARRLSGTGVACYRFDLPNLGEAVLGDAHSENHPYPDDAVQATGETIAFLKDSLGFDNIVLAGICSGSYTAFRYALHEGNSRDIHLAMINPLTFYWEDGMQLRLGAGQVGLGDAKYYDRAIGNLESWKRLLTGKSKTRAIIVFSWRRMMEKLRLCVRLLLDVLSISRPTKLAQELCQIADSGKSFSLFVSSRDIGYELMKTEALSAVSKLERQEKMVVQFIENGDHTFSRSKERRSFIRMFVQHATAIDAGEFRTE